MAQFKDIIGHNHVISYIDNAITQNKVSHAYILNGARGSGKKMLASTFAMALLCDEKKSEPCLQCHSCRQAMGGNHPDIIRVTHEKPGSISVDEIREQVNNDVVIKPYQGPYKIYIINEADLMTTQAQNALLPTIQSRCVMLKLRHIKDSLIKKYLMETMQIPDYQADVCTAFAQGNLGRAIMLAESKHFNEIRDDAIQLLKYIKEMEIPEIAKAIKHIGVYKLDINDYLDIIMIWYRDVLLYKATKDMEVVVFKDQITSIRDQAKLSSYEGLELILDSLETAKTRLNSNVNFDLVMELLLLTIKEN